MIHNEGEQYIVQVLFSGEQSLSTLYAGLDDRETLAETDTLADLTDEPSGNGYAREVLAVGTANFTTAQNVDGDWQVVTRALLFKATGGNVGPVRNIFLATSTDDSGKLIASMVLSSRTTLLDGTGLRADMTLKVSE